MILSRLKCLGGALLSRVHFPEGCPLPLSIGSLLLFEPVHMLLFCLAFKIGWGLRVSPSLVHVSVLSLLRGGIGGSPSGHADRPSAATPHCLHRPSGAAPGWPGRLFPGADQEERGEGEIVVAECRRLSVGAGLGWWEVHWGPRSSVSACGQDHALVGAQPRELVRPEERGAWWRSAGGASGG